MYYLQSRYYDPKDGRFINADTYASTGQGILGHNMFAYCLNNPVRLVDSSGNEPVEAVDTDGDGDIDYYTYEYTYTYIVYLPNNKNLAFSVPQEVTITGNVYIFPDIGEPSNLDASDMPEGFNPTYDLLVGYYATISNGKKNHVMYAYQAHKTTPMAMDSIIDVLLQYDREFNTPWDRTKPFLNIEWKAHRWFSIHPSAQNVDFDNEEEGKSYGYFINKAIRRALGI